MSKDKYNLTLIQQNATTAHCLSPSAFIASKLYQTIYKELTGASQPSFSIGKHQDNYYTTNKTLFIAYTRHCFTPAINKAVA